MNRQILFKAKRKDNGEWVEGGYFSEPYTDKKFIICWNSFGLGFNEFIEVLPDTICQCTGLTDKNGKKIWENDILKGCQYPFLFEGKENYYAEVIWFENCPAFGIYTFKNPKSNVRGISEGNTELMESWNSEDWEVIGNVFDNADLLGVE